MKRSFKLFALFAFLAAALWAGGASAQSTIIEYESNNATPGSAIPVTVIGSGTQFTNATNVWISTSTSSTLGFRDVIDINILADDTLNFKLPCDLPANRSYYAWVENGGSSTFGPYPLPYTGGPSAQGFFVGPPSTADCNVISGQVYFDTDGNCARDTSDFPYRGTQLRLIKQSMPPDTQIVFTDQDGRYAVGVDTGSYRIEPVYYRPPNGCYQYQRELGCLPNPYIDATIGANQDLVDQDFAYANAPVNNWGVWGGFGRLRPGFTGAGSITVRNYSQDEEYNIPMSFTVDPVKVLNLSPRGFAIDSISGGTVYWTIDTLRPGNSRFWFDYETALLPDVQIGELVEMEIYADSTNDECASNNYRLIKGRVRGSYDPNDKTLMEPAPVQDGERYIIPPDSRSVVYRIRFQNTGNAEAIFINLRDTLDGEVFDPASVEMIDASHDYQLTYAKGNVLNWLFDDIMLPDSASDPEGSQGYVLFSVNLREGLPLGTALENRAGVYFDFNPPIITNLETQILDNPTSRAELKNAAPDARLYPNPATGSVTIETPGARIRRVEWRANDGRLVRAQEAANTERFRADLNGMPAGLYSVKIETDKGSVFRQLSVQ